MAIIVGVNIPDNKRIHVGLRRVYGIGPTLAQRLADGAGIQDNPRIGELSDLQLNRIREIIDREYRVEGDLRREVSLNIRRLIDIGCYRGLRHRHGLPLRGQRTRTNARTKRGGRRTVAGKRRAAMKK